MGSSRSISSHCDPKTLSAIDLAFDSAWNVLETRDLQQVARANWDERILDVVRGRRHANTGRDQFTHTRQAAGGQCLGIAAL